MGSLSMLRLSVKTLHLHQEGLGWFTCSHLFNWYFDQWMHYKLSL